MTATGPTQSDLQHSMANAAWLVEVAEHPVRLELTFHDGKTFEAGMPVGAYESVGTSFIASIGEEARLVVDTAPTSSGALAARMLTKRDALLIEETALLYRLAWN